MAVPQNVLAQQSSHLQTVLNRKSNRKRFFRAGLIISNVLVVSVISALVLHNPPSGSTPKASALSVPKAESQTITNPLDRASSADIALTVARLSSLPETTAITNQAQSQAATSAVMDAASSTNVVSKPQVVATALKTRADIKPYVTVEGDSLAAIAAKFGVTSDSIRWSNNLSGESIPVKTSLTIPPVNGIVYTVAAGDTTDSLATTFKASKDKIAAFNDAETRSLKPGEQIMIPDGTKAVPITAAQMARTTGPATASAAVSFPWGGAPVYGGYNGYEYGYCTWYVANKLPVPNNWGNANTWDDLAPRSGWHVSKVPTPGAVGQSNRGAFGHVAVVEAVSEDHTMIKYSDMNGLAGFGRVGYSDWVSASRFDNYIAN
ncbi:MAG: LysM peptidoglycan-binding domain-containing protein [Patescibacteria group bacterium]|nr:LysM peptidoglycan-binding domain-containing protein [Patescibacteria group bacterium]